jgi:UDP-glucose 4-epimerase
MEINVLGGYGFIGGRYCKMTPNVIKNEKYDYQVKSNNILYFISTVHNYNVFTQPYLDIGTNLTTLIKTLETCRDKDLTFNFISSWFVYGDVPLPAKEDSYCDPKGFYSITKRTAEQLLISYCQTFNLKYRILRLGNVLGETDSKVSAKKNALQYLINELKVGNDINLYDGGNVYRDYIYIDDVVNAINLVIKEEGGISCVNDNATKVMGLPVAGLMSLEDPYKVAADYTAIDLMTKSLGSKLGSPFMTLSFMALLVIPHLKLSDKGLFDGDSFKLF